MDGGLVMLRSRGQPIDYASRLVVRKSVGCNFWLAFSTSVPKEAVSP